MGKKNHEKSINSLQQKIIEHQQKIDMELRKDYLDLELIRHWQSHCDDDLQDLIADELESITSS